jgi:hypothetical protein
LARKKSLPRVDCPKFGPNVVFTRENVGPLAAELGISDEEKINEFLKRLSLLTLWHEFAWEKTNHSWIKRELDLLKTKTIELLEEISGLDSPAKEALATGFRRRARRGDPRVRHIDPQVVASAWLTIGVVRDLVDLLGDAVQSAIAVTPKGDGRPSYKSLNQAVLDLARMYEEFSDEKFSREKGTGIWTPGADWVAKVARMVTPKGPPRPTDSQLNTAMRYAARDLRADAREYVPWVDDDRLSGRSEDLQEPTS